MFPKRQQKAAPPAAPRKPGFTLRSDKPALLQEPLLPETLMYGVRKAPAPASRSGGPWEEGEEVCGTATLMGEDNKAPPVTSKVMSMTETLEAERGLTPRRNSGSPLPQ